MKTNPRLILYSIFLLSLTLIPALYYSIAIYFDVNPGNPLYFGIAAVIFGLNMMYALFSLKSTLWKKIALAVIAYSISFFLATMLIRMGINVENDIHGIWKWLIGNAVFTIIAWEITYQLTKGVNSSKMYNSSV